MLQFNILPPEEKKSLHTIKTLRILGIWDGVFFIFLIFSIILLLPSYFLVSFQKEEALRALDISQKSPAENRIADIQRSIIFLKKTAINLQKISASSNAISDLIADSIGHIPLGLILTSFQYEARSSELSFQGIADSRGSLTQFEDALKKNPNIQQLDVPLSSLVSEKNIHFDIKAHLTNQ